MKLRVHRDTLLYAVQRVQAVAERRTSLQILSSFLLEAKDATSARIAATNLQIGLEMAVPAEVDQGGVVAVGARTLFEILRNFPPGQIELEIDEQYWVHVRSGRIHFRIVGASAEGYPDLPQPGKRGAETTGAAVLPAETLRNLIERTIFSISPDETRLHLNSALFQGDGKVLRMVTTDGHRMTCFEETVDVDKRFYRHDVLIPARGLTELRKVLEGVQGDLQVMFETPYVFFDVPAVAKQGVGGAEHATQNVRLAIKLVDATFPPYRQVIPRDNKKLVGIGRDVFASALRRISSISPSRTPTTRLRLEAGKMKISSDNPDIGIGEEDIDIQYEGEAFDIGFNARYLLDILDVVTGENIQLNLGGSLDGCVVREENDERFLAVVMPIRI
ncbi:MAG: DNA polymerase III subunit beta [Deltaproteobacteria bacterium]|nr:DNA polymerase III subunit beta [Deltaproteobacteria bacterium]